MKKLILLLLLPLFARSQDVVSNTDALLTTYSKQDLFSGNVLFAKNGQVVFAKSYGMANKAKNIPNTINTTFRIGSIAKPFTAIVILKLQELGLLNTNDLVSKYLPGYPKGDSITIHNLLSNTSGIPDFIDLTTADDWDKMTSYQDVVPVFKNKALKFKPGTKFDYSSSNFLLLSIISEKATGKSYNQLLKQYIIKPAKLTNTGLDERNRKDAKKAYGYRETHNSLTDTARNVNIGILAAAGGMYSTTGDLLKFDQALNSNVLLNDESKKIMFTPNKDNYGYGWEITSINNQTVIEHSGAIDGFKANIIRFPDSGLTMIVMANYWDIQSFELYQALKQIALNQPFEMPLLHKFIAIDSNKLQNYVGNYAINDRMLTKITLDAGKLVADIPGGPALIMYAESEDKFYLRSKNAYVKFIKDDNGNIKAIEIIKGKRASTWNKK